MGREMSDLKMMQALPLSVKILLTKRRIRDWVNEYGIDGVYVSFSGGKDSTVLLKIAREMYPDIKAVFVDTGLEYPEIRNFVRTWDNVEWLKPKMNFRRVIEKYGYPFISKEVSERVYYAQKYLAWEREHGAVDKTGKPTAYGLSELLGLRPVVGAKRGIDIVNEINHETIIDCIKQSGKGTYKISALLGDLRKDGKKNQYNYEKYLWLVGCPYPISNHCCGVMKKSPVHSYSKATGRLPILGTMAVESRLRLSDWKKNGCNGFDMKSPRSMPMAFWTEQDVLQYIYRFGIKIAAVYGDVVVDGETEAIPGQLTLGDNNPEWAKFNPDAPKLKTTVRKRTGCMFCGYGCHLEKPGEGRFEQMKLTHPKQYEWIMKSKEEGGLGYKDVIDWLNEHGNLNIRY